MVCSPRDSQESSPAPQFESINFLALSLLYGPTPVHDYWENRENHSFANMDLCQQSVVSAFNKLSRFVMGFPGLQLEKDSSVMQETPVGFPGREDPLEKR